MDSKRPSTTSSYLLLFRLRFWLLKPFGVGILQSNGPMIKYHRNSKTI